jgi:hypothetical protein
MTKTLTLTASLAAVLIAAVAPAAQAKPVVYSGTTSAGDAITFKLAGSAITDLHTATPTTCVPLDGEPRDTQFTARAT